MANPSERTLREALMGSIDPFKGLLILLVVLDHNDVAHALLPATMRPLTFHVLGFLLLPFLIGKSKLSKSFVLVRFARYGVPQFWILTLSAILLWLLKNPAEPFLNVMHDYLLALFIGSAPLVKQSSGFLAYWFLPTLLGLVVVLAAYRQASKRWRLVISGCFVVTHFVFVESFFHAYWWVPFGLAIVGNIFILGVVLAAIVESKTMFAIRWIFPMLFVLSYGWLVYTNTWLEVANLVLTPVTMPVAFIAQDVAGLSGILTVLILADRLKGNKALASIGELSLMIYLVHPLVYAALESGTGIIHWQPSSIATNVLYGVFSYGVALSVAWMAAGVIARSKWLSEWITPRGRGGWPPLAAFRSANAG